MGHKHFAAGFLVGSIACTSVAVIIALSGKRPSGAEPSLPTSRVVMVVNQCGDVETDSSGHPITVPLPIRPPLVDTPAEAGVYPTLAPLPEQGLIAVPIPADPVYLSARHANCKGG